MRQTGGDPSSSDSMTEYIHHRCLFAPCCIFPASSSDFNAPIPSPGYSDVHQTKQRFRRKAWMGTTMPDASLPMNRLPPELVAHIFRPLHSAEGQSPARYQWDTSNDEVVPSYHPLCWTTATVSERQDAGEHYGLVKAAWYVHDDATRAAKLGIQLRASTLRRRKGSEPYAGSTRMHVDPKPCTCGGML
ncbi:hypothetical protein BKA70DRAFT_1300363 [Coprinopsis sp. MPI-PUGE-AT-0042]|nr:hypothetical protein BKA70DRAFT_1300363 [Coprinopsis sp. MPI-PUGE-AT-0042]